MTKHNASAQQHSGKRRDKDTGNIHTFLFHSLMNGIEDRHTRNVLTSFSGSHTGDHPGSVSQHLPGVKSTFSPGHSLYNDSAVFIHEYAQDQMPPST